MDHFPVKDPRGTSDLSRRRALVHVLRAALAAAALTSCVGGTVPDPTSAPPLLFSADDGAHGVEPWLTDGTAAGTRLLADIAPGPTAGSDFLRVWFALDGALFFNARPGGAGTDALHRSDGTSAGTESIAAGVALPAFGAFAFGDVAVFSNDVHANSGLYRSDGTAAGTVRLGDAVQGLFTGVRVPKAPAHLRHRVGDGAVFVVYEGELLRVDAAGAETLHVFDDRCIQSRHVGVLGTVLFFSVADPFEHPVTGVAQDARCELWRFDTALDAPPAVHRSFTLMPDQRADVTGFAEKSGWLYYNLVVNDVSDLGGWAVVTRQVRATNGTSAPPDTLLDDEGDVLVPIDPAAGWGFHFLQRAPDEPIYLFGANADTGYASALALLHTDGGAPWIEVVDAGLASTNEVEASFTWVGEHLVYRIPGESGGLFSVRNGSTEVATLLSGADALVWTALLPDSYADRLAAWFDEPAAAAGLPGTGLVSSLFVTDGTPEGTSRVATFCYQTYYGCTSGED
jgi:ELWxxDGT repeat protein